LFSWTFNGFLNKQELCIKLESELSASDTAHSITRQISSARDAQIRTLEGEITELKGVIKTKDVMLKALQERCESLNREYHNKVFKRKATTLEDVYRLTGEGGVREKEKEE
jgi:predicted RNase H-like nuclease (RuvC/YqgF family)